MASTVLVPSSSANSNEESLVTSKYSKSFDRAKQTKSSVDKKTKLTASGMDSSREKLSAEGLSEESVILIENARRARTVSHYKLAWRKWDSWCVWRKIAIEKWRFKRFFVLKLITFLVLTSAGRGSDTVYLDASYQIKHPSGYIFQYGKPTKTSTKTKQKNPLKFYPFRKNKDLCVCHHIDLHLNKMKEFHKTEAQLLLSFIKPHKGVTTQTISRWILEILGSNTKVFTGNSTRSASTCIFK